MRDVFFFNLISTKWLNLQPKFNLIQRMLHHRHLKSKTSSPILLLEQVIDSRPIQVFLIFLFFFMVSCHLRSIFTGSFECIRLIFFSRNINPSLGFVYLLIKNRRRSPFFNSWIEMNLSFRCT